LAYIPEGSIPVKTNDYQIQKQLNLKSFTTKTFEYLFYFPSEGEFKLNSANVTKNDEVIAKS
jgi:hypothetical protein